MESYCFAAFAEALEVIPTTLAENAGLNPITMVTELRNRHANGERSAGINVRKGVISNILEENVLQPLLVSTSAIELATETVGLLLRIGEVSFSLLLPECPRLRRCLELCTDSSARMVESACRRLQPYKVRKKNLPLFLFRDFPRPILTVHSIYSRV